MTLATIFHSFSGSSSAGRGAHGYFSEKNSGAAEYYHYGSYKKSKGKSKSDKKHAVLSALTLLAFLFFLNILQNCIREQSQNRGTMMMFLPTAPTGQQSKEPDPGQPGPQKENQSAKEMRSGPKEQRETWPGSEAGGRKTRNLLGVPTSEDPPLNKRREVKFIRNFNDVNNWTRELSQVSDKDLEEQKLKTGNFPLYWKNKELVPPETKQSYAAPSRATFASASSASKTEKTPSVLRKITKRERTDTASRLIFAENETVSSSNDTVQKPLRDYKNSLGKKPEAFQGNKLIFHKGNDHFYHKRRQTFRPDGAWKGFDKTPIGEQNDSPPLRNLTTSIPAPPTPQTTPTKHHALPAPDRAPTTPRTRRSDHSTAPSPPPDHHQHDAPDPRVRQRLRPAQAPAPVLGLDLNTFHTFPVYNYYDHRSNADLYGENETTTAVASEAPDPGTEPPPPPPPLKTSPLTLGPPFFDFGNKYYNHRGRYPSRNHYPADHRYKYSPHRKTAPLEGPHFHEPLHDDYRLVLANYPPDKGPAFHVVDFLWTLFSSFAKPFTKLVPSFAKEDDRQPQCFDLLLCEAQRVSTFMGPTAEALTATLGRLLTWGATGETRQSVADALSAGRENTCQEQIRHCEGRSGGKSAMTLIAQLMEMKLR